MRAEAAEARIRALEGAMLQSCNEGRDNHLPEGCPRAIAAEQRLARYERISESGESLGGELEEREARMAAQERIRALEGALRGLMELESRGRIMPAGKEWDAARAAIDAEAK